ncbi:MAG: 2'-5' RNA ligase family protein [Bifidobacteriaceae bacterium]|jgi:2'-5' RNA ligase|nr:2'-5' RNA ligase family protein [Bifidobacteriaceae bacterium]
MRIPHLGPDQLCIGIAVMVPPPLSGRLHRLRRASGDPAADSAPPHITVIPPMPVDRSALPGAMRRVQAVAAQVQRFEVRLRGAGTFRPVSPVVFAQVDEGFEVCQVLAARVRAALGAPADRFPYHPHVTVAQDAPDAQLDRVQQALDGFDASFTAQTVEVSQLESDAVWRRLRRFQLAAPASGAPGLAAPASTARHEVAP